MRRRGGVDVAVKLMQATSKLTEHMLNARNYLLNFQFHISLWLNCRQQRTEELDVAPSRHARRRVR